MTHDRATDTLTTISSASRRSLRAFLPQAVDAQTLEQVFAVAQRAPSNCNTQPWLVHVASGESWTSCARNA